MNRKLPPPRTRILLPEEVQELFPRRHAAGHDQGTVPVVRKEQVLRPQQGGDGRKRFVSPGAQLEHAEILPLEDLLAFVDGARFEHDPVDADPEIAVRRTLPVPERAC